MTHINRFVNCCKIVGQLKFAKQEKVEFATFLTVSDFFVVETRCHMHQGIFKYFKPQQKTKNKKIWKKLKPLKYLCKSFYIFKRSRKDKVTHILYIGTKEKKDGQTNEFSIQTNEQMDNFL